MSLMDTMPEQSRNHMKLQSQFEELPETDKVNVIELVKLGKRTVNPDDVEAHAIPELSEAGRSFVDGGLFREMYDISTHREVPAPTNMAGHEMNPMMRGLFEMIKNLTGGKVLDPDHSNRMGGGESGPAGPPEVGGGSNYESRLGSAYKSGGSRGLAFAHRNLLNDPSYSKFLKGDK